MIFWYAFRFPANPFDYLLGEAVAEQQKRSAHALEGKYERHDAKPNKVCPFFFDKLIIFIHRMMVCAI